MTGFANIRLGLVHDWLTGMRGGEKCLERLCLAFPTAKLYTLLHAKGSLSAAIERLEIHPSWLNRLPGIVNHYRYTLPLMPFAAKWPFAPCDLLVSFSHAVAKAAIPPKGVPHVSYCFTPMRYAWHMKESYFGGRVSGLKSRLISEILRRIREWDRQVSDRVTHFIAISKTIQDRIRDSYQRDSVIIYPPVDTRFYTPDAQTPREDFYLIISAFAPYKRLDLAIEACNALKKRLVIIGSGQDAARLKSLAGPSVEFLGWKSNSELRDHLRRCRALLFPGEEDFGIVPVEANACGTPVIAYAKGGATETVVPFGQSKPTGFWFEQQSTASLIHAIEVCEREHAHLDPNDSRRKAVEFDQDRFDRELLGYLERVWKREV